MISVSSKARKLILCLIRAVWVCHRARRAKGLSACVSMATENPSISYSDSISKASDQNLFVYLSAAAAVDDVDGDDGEQTPENQMAQHTLSCK